MVDLKLIRENIDAVRQMLVDRHIAADLDRLVELDTRWRENLTYTQSLKAHQNKVSQEIAQLKKEKTGCHRDDLGDARTLPKNQGTPLRKLTIQKPR